MDRAWCGCVDLSLLSLGIEIADGMFSRMIQRNSILTSRRSHKYVSLYLPHTLTVSFAKTNNERIASLRRSISNRLSPSRYTKAKGFRQSTIVFLGQFELRGIQSAPKGVPQIEVTFELDPEGNMDVRAVDMKTSVQPSTACFLVS
jgi:molecular chaperone DnaK (HSP70)